MSFNGAHRFNIIVNRDFNQVDMSSRGNFEMMNLVNAACPGASYESAERADPPRCHPKTRKKIIEDIMDWVNSSDPEKKIMWFNGVAGAGKSAIAQTIAERGFHEGKLLSSFFFSRTATGSGRNDGSRLIPTIAYHLAIAIPEAANFIIAELNRDPAMLHHSMEVQLKRLIMDPIEQLRGTGKAYIPYLVIIDGLDECNGLQVQSGIIKTIASTLKQSPFHMRFLIVSRPEWEIQKTFSLLSINNVSVRLSLNDDSSAYHDIEVYLKSEFDKMKKTHTLAAYLSDDLNWPSKWDIWTLVNRSSGQFIYASTVMKYIVNDDRDPREALNGIIHRSTENMFNENPFAQLDALYNHILSVAASKTKGGRDAIFAVLQVIVLFNNIRTFYDDQTMFSTGAMAQFLGIKKSDLELWMVHLHSIILVSADRGSIRFYHASAKDFLLDSSRDSGTYPIRVFGFEINKYQYIIKYLLERIKPSLEFGISVQKMLLALEILIAEFSRRVHPASLNYVMWYHDKIDINDIIEYFQDYLLQFDESHRESDDDLDFENDAYPTNPYMYLPPPATDNDEATQGSLPHTNSDLEVNKEDDEEDHNGANISDISMKGIGVDAYPTNPYIPPPVTDNEATQGSLPDTNSDLEVNEEDDEEDHSSANISNISMKCIDQNSQPRETMQDILYSPPRLRVDAYPTNPYTYLPPLSSDSNKATQGSLPEPTATWSMKCIDQNSQPRENMQNILHPLLDNYRNSNMEREAGKLVENDHIASAKVNKQSIERVGHVDAVSHVPEFDSNQPEVRLRAKTTGRNMLEEQIQETL
ncbi:hypothetical protein BDQ17DRAFT_1433812 [Cyathus striatus]|nr:hypothetical protein BDQ17DRAFT_1433812 [Cyathus striatus]